MRANQRENFLKGDFIVLKRPSVPCGCAQKTYFVAKPLHTFWLEKRFRKYCCLQMAFSMNNIAAAPLVHAALRFEKTPFSDRDIPDCRWLLFDAELVADTAHGLEPDRIGRVLLDLAAKAIDLDVDRAFADIAILTGQFMAGIVSPARSAKIAMISCSRSVSLIVSVPFFSSRRGMKKV